MSEKQDEFVILVDPQDRPRGLMEKQEAHVKGELHRAFSVFVFNKNGELLLQQRALHKYHSGGLWTNTCCSHPREGETILEAGHRRLQEEMGFDCELTHRFSFIYRAELDLGLTENELDHVMTGVWEGKLKVNPDEVGGWKYMTLEAVKQDIEERPELYTAWFKIIFDNAYLKLLSYRYNE